MLSAQTVTSIPYTMSFEEDEVAEWQNWQVNPGANAATCPDQWQRGHALHSDGVYGLYISNDGGATSNAGDVPNLQFAYRDFYFEDGAYYVSFDYIVPNAGTMLYAGFLSWTGATPSQQASNMVAQSALSQATGIVAMPNVGMISTTETEAGTWRSANFMINVTNPASGYKTCRLWFAWENQLTDSIQGISAALDNIQITDARCAAPDDLKVEVVTCDEVNVSWAPGADKYEVQYRSIGMNSWRKRGVNGDDTQLSLESMKEGNYDFRVRGTCYVPNQEDTTKIDTVVSPFSYLSNVNIFCPDQHCINYVNLQDTQNVICTHGKTGGNNWGFVANKDRAYDTQGALDYGWESVNSHHTVCWDKTAYDERTNGQLKVVPNGADASVRLGNWASGGEADAEAITYKFTVDPDNSIILINYAVVMEEPGHEDTINNHFILEIKDKDGNLINPTCGYENFNPNDAHAKWNTCQYTGAGSSYGTTIKWKDWTSEGLNLEPYRGQEMQISLATYDCFYQYHYAYAYFTIDCASAHIKNTACGAQQEMTVVAPDGFTYQWFETESGTNPTDDPTIVRSTERTLTVGLADATNWTCRLTSKQNTGCFFDLDVATQPRYPRADFEMVYEPKNCENRYVVKNKSYIIVNNNGTLEENHEDYCDDFLWNFGMDTDTITDDDPGVVIFPKEGGRFQISLTAMIGDGTGSCRHDTAIWLDVPALTEEHRRLDTTLCVGDYIEWHGEIFFQDTLVHTITLNEAGCPLEDTLSLKVVDNIIVEHDTLKVSVDNEFILFEGDTIRLSSHREVGLTEVHTFSRVSATGCDSTILLPITFLPCQQFIYQRWNDVLSILGPAYNGVGEIASFQWYRDDKPLRGETKSYLYEKGGLKKAVYTCEVTYPDGTKENACNFIPEFYDEAKVSVSPSLLRAGESVTIQSEVPATAAIYSTLGWAVQTALPVEKGETLLSMPSTPGMYIISVSLSGEQKAFRICVTE